MEQPKKMFVALEITGTAPLMQNSLSPSESKEPRDCVEAATIRNVKGDVCMPAVAFKYSMLTASTQIKGFRKTQLRTQFYVEGQSISVAYDTMTLWTVRVPLNWGSRTPVVCCYRPTFNGWKARLVIQFSDLLAVQTVVDLLNRAGEVGVGEWRPEKGGVFGTFTVTRHIDDPAEIAEVRAACGVRLATAVIQGRYSMFVREHV